MLLAAVVTKSRHHIIKGGDVFTGERVYSAEASEQRVATAALMARIQKQRELHRVKLKSSSHSRR